MVSRIVAVSFPRLWDKTEASVLLSTIGVCRIDIRVKPVVEGLEERSVTSSYAGRENSVSGCCDKGDYSGSTIGDCCRMLSLRLPPPHCLESGGGLKSLVGRSCLHVCQACVLGLKCQRIALRSDWM